MRRFTFVLAYFCLSIALSAQVLYTENKDNEEGGERLAFDSENNAYVCGYFSNGYFQSGGGYISCRVQKINPQGQQVWAKDLQVYGITVRSFFIMEDTIYVYGSYNGGGAYLLPGPAGPPGAAFLLKIDKSGNTIGGAYIFTNKLGTWETGYLIPAPDGFYFTCSFSRKLAWGSDTIADIDTPGAAIISFDRYFNIKWKKIFEHPVTYPPAHISLVNNRLFLSGGFKSNMTIDGFSVNTTYESNYLLCMDTLGNTKWLKQFGSGYGDSYALEHVVDSSGSSYVYGRAYQFADFGTVNLTASSSFYFLAKYDMNGTPLWAEKRNLPVNRMIMHGNTLVTAPADTVDGNRYLEVYDGNGNLIQTLYAKNVSVGDMQFFGNEVALTGSYRNGSPFGDIAASASNCFPCNVNDFFFSRASMDLAIGIHEVMANDAIHLYPNPASGVISISLPPGSKQAEISLYNSFGEKALETKQPANGSVISLDLTDEAPGLYLAELVSDGKRYAYKVILE